jgi:hypothetical protein
MKTQTSLGPRTRRNRLRQAALLALDPSAILRARGLTPDHWQMELLTSSRARQVLLNCSRQSGKSTAVAALALHTLLFRPRSLTLLLSPSLRQSLELFRKVMECADALPQSEKPRVKTLTQLELPNRSRIVSLPGKEETVRSFSGVALLVIDEAARVPDDLYRSVRPMLAVSQGRLICLSTPFGKRGFFYSEWTDQRAPWQRFQVAWQDCPRIRPEFIAEETRAMGESWVRQEYLCSFEALEGLVYTDFASLSSLSTRHPALSTSERGEPVGRPVGGIDFGFRNPFAALWGVLDRDDVLWITHERYLRETPIHEHAAALPRNVLWYADPAGATEAAELRRAGLNVHQGNNDIQAGIAAVTARLRTGRLRVDVRSCPNLLAEAERYRYPTARDGKPTSEAPVDEHNHALAALRYLVSTLDAGFVARFRRKTSPQLDPTGPAAGALATPSSSRPRRYLSLHNESLWTRLS